MISIVDVVRKVLLGLSILVIFIGHIHAQTLTVTSKSKSQIFNKNHLQQWPLANIKINYSRAYPGKLLSYKAIKLCDFLKPFKFNANKKLLFTASDDFAVIIPAKLVLNCKKEQSIAYLAIEPDKKWPLLSNHTNQTAGPLAVIWTSPHLSYISDEYWAWSLVKISEYDDSNEAFVIKAPQKINSSNKKEILNGYKVYVSHCSSCHTINHIGTATIGPDLSSPHNPLDYYPNKLTLKKFIRNPQSVRYLKNGRMSGSSQIGLKEKDLNDLISYFTYMKKF